MNQKLASLIGLGVVVAGALLLPTGAVAKDRDRDSAEPPPLKVVDAAGKSVGRLYGNAKGDFVVVRLGNAQGSMRLVEDGSLLLPAESASSILWTAPRCGGQAVIPTGGTPPGSGLPNVPSIGSYRTADHRLMIYLPTTSTPQRITIYSQGAPGPTCNYQINPIAIFGVPAEAASLDSYFVLPFRIE